MVAAINSGSFVPFGLGEGAPSSARLLSEERPVSRLAVWVAQNPDRPLARFFRYIVLRYSTGTDTNAVRGTLAAGGQLESAEPNLGFQSAFRNAERSILRLVRQPGSRISLNGEPDLLRLAQAWEWGKGHAQVGILDTGVLRTHPELRTYTFSSQTLQYTYAGGNVHEHLSYDELNQRCDIDERDSPTDPFAGHGSHVTGIVAAKANNALGVAGVCWYCGIQMQKVFPPRNTDTIPAILERSRRCGRDLAKPGGSGDQRQLRNSDRKTWTTARPRQVSLLQPTGAGRRAQILFVASAGNDISSVNFPARDPRVLAVGGVERIPLSPPLTGYWLEPVERPGRLPRAPLHRHPGVRLEFRARDRPGGARAGRGFLLLYRLHPQSLCPLQRRVPLGRRSRRFRHPGDGFGVCRGTSMSAPFVTGIAALVRSANPLLSKNDVIDVLTSTASQAAAPAPPLGSDCPTPRRRCAAPSAKAWEKRCATGSRRFHLQSLADASYLATTSPQEASARTFDNVEPYDTAGPLIPWYDLPGACTISPCPQNRPGASLYIFTTDQPPYPGAPPLAPLYKLRWDPDLYFQCTGNSPDLPRTRYTYSTTDDGISHFKNLLDPDFHLGFDLDGRIGYMYDWCEPDSACQPPGTVKVYRMYHPGQKAWALVSELELAAYSNAGYTLPPLYRAVIGYAYPNLDSDGDRLIDGFERLAGSDPSLADTDCDGASDGEEVLLYDRTDPDPARHGYGDPLAGPCAAFFFDDFELGHLGRWSAVTLGGPDPDI